MTDKTLVKNRTIPNNNFLDNIISVAIVLRVFKTQNAMVNIKQFVLLIGFILPITCSYASILEDGHHSHVPIKEGCVQGVPKGSSIQATIDGHYLSVVFLDNLGQVTVEISSAIFGESPSQSTPTPNGVSIYIPYTGSYIVTFTLPNGDEYYGEFEVTD